jgi:hypothetical protein
MQLFVQKKNLYTFVDRVVQFKDKVLQYYCSMTRPSFSFSSLGILGQFKIIREVFFFGKLNHSRGLPKHNIHKLRYCMHD